MESTTQAAGGLTSPAPNVPSGSSGASSSSPVPAAAAPAASSSAAAVPAKPAPLQTAGVATGASVCTFTKYARLLGEKIGTTTAYAAGLIRETPELLDELAQHLVAEIAGLKTSLPAVAADVAQVETEVKTDLPIVEQDVQQIATEAKVVETDVQAAAPVVEQAVEQVESAVEGK